MRVQLGVGCAGTCSDPIGTSFEPRGSSVYCVLYYTCTVCNVHTLTYIYMHIYIHILCISRLRFGSIQFQVKRLDHPR